MRFGIFYEHQIPRPWTLDGEHRLLKDALDQVEIADRVGFHSVWEVEHHFLEEYSHSSAPEVFLAAASQRTKRIRLGHGIVQIPPGVNHPARVAERLATLDLVSDGRVEFGTGESSSAAELGGFLVDRETKRAQWEDALDAITRMFVETPFAGWESEFFRMPPRNVVPKPLQRPHPPLWVACSRRETIHLAARRGIGALSFSFVEPEDAGQWVREYYDLIRSPECVPAGFAVNPNVAVVLPMMCHADEETAIERGIDGAHFFGYSLAHYYGMSSHEPGRTNVWDEFERRRESTGFARGLITADKAPLGVKILQEGVGSLRGAIGTPAQITELLRRYEAVGVDQVIFLLQAGRNAHAHICESLELFGREVLPAFAGEADAREHAKAERLLPAIEAALLRRKPARSAPPYAIDEQAEVLRAHRARRAPSADGTWTASATARARARLRRGAASIVGGLVHGKSDLVLEQRFGRPLVQRAIFAAMARAFDPAMARGFRGAIVYELTRAGAPEPQRWTLRVDGARATASHGDHQKPDVRYRMGVADFARILAGENPLRAIMAGRVAIDGDVQLAMRVAEMFGGAAPY